MPDTRHGDAVSSGIGKSWLACALAHKACRDDRSVLYYRAPRLFDALALARHGEAVLRMDAMAAMRGS